jgi:glucose-1-phosphate cytidylyltransferase
MKVLLLAGGYGTRLSEETEVKPKPMIDIGGRSILWHIMKIYSYYGYNDFVILLGYKGYIIKEYFANYFLHQSDVTIDMVNNKMEILNNTSEPWKVTLLDTGVDTMTGGRVLRAKQVVGNEPFLLTYGDGVSDVNIKELVDFHEKSGKYLTITAVQPEGRFGRLDIGKDNVIRQFHEKPIGDGAWINGGFFVCQPEVFAYIQNDSTMFERGPLERLSSERQIAAYRHSGFWKPMDTIRDKYTLTELVNAGRAPWMIWRDNV